MTDTNRRYAEFLLPRATREGECLISHLSKSTHGYCKCGENELAHRLVYQALKGEVPEGLYVLHTCDNRACINPKHLFLGTQKENVDDMMRKGRHVRPLTFKLTPGQVIEAKQLRAQGWIYRRIAARYGVTISTARNYIVGISSYASTSR